MRFAPGTEIEPMGSRAMTVRYRIRTSAGQELSFASREMFEDFVRSGDLSPDDLVYDGESGSWSPARTHPTVLEIQYELDEAGDGGPADEVEAVAASTDEADDAEPEADDARGGLDATGRKPDQVGREPEDAEADDAHDDDAADAGGEPGMDLELDLVLPEEKTPEEEQRAFMERLEAERQSDLDEGPSLRDSISGFTLGSHTLRAPPGEAPADDVPAHAKKREPRPEPRVEPRRESRPAPPPKPKATEKKKSGGLGRMVALLLLLTLLGGGGYVGYEMLRAGGEPPAPEEDGPGEVVGELPEEVVDPVEPAPDPVDEGPVPDEAGPDPPAPSIPGTEAAVRERAQERYLTATQAELRDLQPIPDVWPEGPYLTVPSDYPEVVDVWQSYVTTIRRVRESDTERYRTAYVAALEDAAVTGEVGDERLQRGMAAFAETDSLRRAHFDRVEALATAAIQSHNALVEAEGLILYDATGSTGRSEGIGQGTSGRDAESQLLLDQVVELLTAGLEADGEGPRTGENVREWVWDGFLDAATR